MRRSVRIAGTILALAVVFGAVLVVFTTPTVQTLPPETADSDERELFRFEGDDSGVWTYLSPSREFRKRSPINVVVREDADTVVELLRSSDEHTWNRTDETQRPAEPTDPVPEGFNLTGTTIEWGETTGTARYAYVHDGESGEWIRETDQLHNGDYYGYRTHIRLYESPVPDEEPWVAMQVHTEHFDWFTLRHAVDGVQRGQRQVERDLMSEPYVERVWRAYLDNDGPSDADGWATVVELFVAIPVGLGLVSARELWRQRLTAVDRRRIRAVVDRVTVRHGLLFGSIVALVLGVRAAGVLLEWYVPALSMHAIAALLYPFVAVGIPIVTYAFASGIRRRMDAAVTGASALSVAFFLDYGYLGVEVLPIEIVLQRVGVVLALGLIAGGAAQRATADTHRNRLLVAGLLLWAGLLLGTLFEYIG
ncbi:hypothetical protein [Halapricum desulfuricans]|uniref:Putative membrane protein n=1 Tax=Halapricum desulfuricans TaxID=2841257 RepID=A0A897NIS5_9EURY|nr:hypothetical protein [Halapricum desulfuricans]QSG10206.1 putative membrane protein [Halapricum desulfuricans]